MADLRRPASKFDESIDDALDLRSDDDVWETVLQNLQAQDVRRALENLPDDQRETYRRLLSEAQVQYDEIQHELAVLSSLLQELQ